MTTFRAATAMLAVAGVSSFSQASLADMGTSPAGPQGTVLSFEGGYLHQDGPSITGHGIASAPVLAPGDPVTDIHVSPESGYFFGGLIGYDNGKPYIFGFHRVELNLMFGRTRRQRAQRRSPGRRHRTHRPLMAWCSAETERAATTKSERRTWEGSLRFEDDDRHQRHDHRDVGSRAVHSRLR